MQIRDDKQKEFAKQWVDSEQFSILNLCPRFGKIRVSIHILNHLKAKRVLIAYPDSKIKEGWDADFEELGFDTSNVTYTTHLSLKNHTTEVYDVVIIDEIHLLSEAQIEICSELFMLNRCVLGLTGTLMSSTKWNLRQLLGLKVLCEYTIEQGIADGIIVDYEITVIKVPLDDKVFQQFGKKLRTEKKQFNALTWVINDMEGRGDNSMFIRLSRMRVIQNSLAKLNKTIELLTTWKDERVLVFCGTTKIADRLGIPTYHSKVKEKQLFEDFASGKGNQMAVVKIGNSGVTYKPLNKIIINYFDSNGENLAQKLNRCMGYEYDNPDKKAHIYIICTTEPTEAKWLEKALEFFDKSKIKYV